MSEPRRIIHIRAVQTDSLSKILIPEYLKKENFGDLTEYDEHLSDYVHRVIKMNNTLLNIEFLKDSKNKIKAYGSYNFEYNFYDTKKQSEAKEQKQKKATAKFKRKENLFFVLDKLRDENTYLVNIIVFLITYIS